MLARRAAVANSYSKHQDVSVFCACVIFFTNRGSVWCAFLTSAAVLLHKEPHVTSKGERRFYWLFCDSRKLYWKTLDRPPWIREAGGATVRKLCLAIIRVKRSYKLIGNTLLALEWKLAKGFYRMLCRFHVNLSLLRKSEPQAIFKPEVTLT